MTSHRSVAFIGGGRIARILLEGWRVSEKMPTSILVVEPDERALAPLRDIVPEVRAVDVGDLGACEVVFLAVHPPVLKGMLERLADAVSPDALVVSLAPKVKAAAIAAALGTDRVARMIPNAPSAIGAGYNPVFFSRGVDRESRQELKKMFAPWGEQPEVAEESLEAYAIVTAMGPTYFWYEIQKLCELAVSFGLEQEAANEAVRKMLDGAVRCLLAKGPGAMDLIPVRPLEELEPTVTSAFETKLTRMFEKLRS
jgi:pyrroline-5-carboxylate reductase